MAPRIKITEFVASTARYSRKAATRADKNKNSRLTAAEAKALPADLQDDYKRQAKKKPAMSPAAFAKAQTAYAAASARHADKNHDGYLSASEQRALPRALRDNLANFNTASTDRVPGGAASPFLGAGRGANQKLGGVKASKLPVSTAVARLMKKLEAQAGSTVFSAGWKFAPAELANALAHPDKHPDFLNHLLFESTGTSYQRDYPDYYDAARLSESRTSPAAAAKEIADDLRQGNDAGILGTTRGLVALMNAPGVQFTRLFWTNDDDAAFMGLMAFNTRTGEVASFGWVNEP